MIISVTAQKGGTGKTTLAVSLAGEARRIGYSVLLVDADPQGSATRWFEQADEDLAEDWPDLVDASDEDMEEDVRAQHEDYDLIVIDCPPQHHNLTEIALTLSDLAILPITPSALDLWAMVDHTLPLFQEVWKKRPKLKGLLAISKKQPRTRLGSDLRDILDEVEESRWILMKTEVGQRTDFARLPTSGALIHQTVPKSHKARKEITALWKEVVKHGQKEISRQ